MGFLSHAAPPLDFPGREFICLSLLMLNQVDWCMARHWRSTGGSNCPDPLFDLLTVRSFQLLTHNETSHREEEGLL